LAANNGASSGSLSTPSLKRSIGLVLLTLYGLGTILGAGIYVLVGEVARSAGAATPAAFVLAGVIATFSALSYAELGGRLPKSAGEAAYIEAAFEWPAAAGVIGWAVIATGIISSATLVRGFVGYLDVFVSLPSELVIVLLVLGLGALASWGIAESMWAAGVITVVEVLGLLAVCFIARDSLAGFPDQWTNMLPTLDAAALAGVLSGAFIAFYAFIGFEDMVNVAEEVVAPERTVPYAIVAALVLSTALYLLVAVVATLALPLTVLAGNDAPMAAIVESRGYSPVFIAFVGLFAVINGALIQLVMASRVLYGLGMQGLVWPLVARVHVRRRTPVVASAVVALGILIFALALPIGRLARLTSFVALAVFTAVNMSLIVLKKRAVSTPLFSVPAFVPLIGAALSGGMLVLQLVSLIESWGD
jgi:amino acid transporter